jgi:cystathionine gamma-lyase
MGFATNAIHVGQEPDPATGAVVAPIYQTSTYVYEELGKHKGYDYSRSNHPNRKALERTVAKLEGGHSAYVFTSGMAAIDAVFRLFRPGDHVVLSEAVYGGVYRLSTQLLVQFWIGIQLCGYIDSGLCAVGHAAEYEADLYRDADKSDDARDGYQRDRETG